MWSDEWRAVRERVLDRDGRTCRECPTSAEDVGEDGLHAHHVRPRAEDGPDERENCITLCEDCHGARHRGRTSYYDSEFVQVVRGYGPVSVGEVAEWMTCSRSTARRRLAELETRGVVERVENGDSVVWRPPRSLFSRVLDAIRPF